MTNVVCFLSVCLQVALDDTFAITQITLAMMKAQLEDAARSLNAAQARIGELEQVIATCCDQQVNDYVASTRSAYAKGAHDSRAEMARLQEEAVTPMRVRDGVRPASSLSPSTIMERELQGGRDIRRRRVLQF
jgi:hypothetical protein